MTAGNDVGIDKTTKPGDSSSVWGGAGLQAHVGSICLSLLQGALQVAAPFEVPLQQGLAAHPHPTHGAVVRTAAGGACTLTALLALDLIVSVCISVSSQCLHVCRTPAHGAASPKMDSCSLTHKLAHYWAVTLPATVVSLVFCEALLFHLTSSTTMIAFSFTIIVIAVLIITSVCLWTGHVCTQERQG